MYNEKQKMNKEKKYLSHPKLKIDFFKKSKKSQKL